MSLMNTCSFRNHNLIIILALQLYYNRSFIFFETLMPYHRIASEIQRIKSIVGEIQKRGKKYNFLSQPSFEQGQSSNKGGQSVKWIDPRLYSRHLDEAEVVGLEDPRDELIRWLVEEPTQRSVIFVVGMGGLGKTTLAGRVFNNQKVIAHFDYHAWITVSQSYTVEGLMRDLLKKLRKEKRLDPLQGISEMDLDPLIEAVKSHLQHKRYVVIFDDVWGIDFWGQIENVIPDNKNGSKILITTRSMDVVGPCRNSPIHKVHELKPLTTEKSMELFCKKAFRYHNNGHCPEDLIHISQDFVKKCKGLPLAIVAIGSLLSGKEKTSFHWEKIMRSLSSEMEKNPHLIGMTKIIDFSYDDLPYYLKSCLLYFGLYPEDYEVESTRLIQQWIAEGFVKEERGKTLEDTAQEYLSELIRRSLVQVSSFSVDGEAESCRIHDLLHEMILKKSKDLSFCQRISKEDKLMSSKMIRRLSIASISNDLMGSTESSHIRSLLVFARDEFKGAESKLAQKFVQRIPTEYRLLKVLDFQDSPLSFFPESWGSLAHLKYLNLRKSNFSAPHLLKFIGNLQNLETLDIWNSRDLNMPKEICKLRKLRHLLCNGMKLFQLKNGLGGMTSLQTLSLVNLTMADDDGLELIQEMGKLNQLRKLCFKGVKEKHGSTLCSSISQMTNLEKLKIVLDGSEVIDLPVISSLSMLRELKLQGKLKKFPEWLPQLQNLVKLTLYDSELTDDPLKSLQNMPHLLFLDISMSAYKGESLNFQDGGFQQLRELLLWQLSDLKSIIIDKGALHSLKNLQLWNLPKLKTVPHGIQYLEKLEVLDVDGMADEFIECMAPVGGPEDPIIQHVPLIKITIRAGRGEFKTRVIHHKRQ